MPILSFAGRGRVPIYKISQSQRLGAKKWNELVSMLCVENDDIVHWKRNKN